MSLTLKSKIVQNTITKTGMVPKCTVCNTEIKNEEERFFVTYGPDLEKGIVQHTEIFRCFQNSPELRARQDEIDRNLREAAQQKWLKQMEERRKKEEEYRERGIV
jgi:hypothetical protein